jgi:hypothetical protein
LSFFLPSHHFWKLTDNSSLFQDYPHFEKMLFKLRGKDAKGSSFSSALLSPPLPAPAPVPAPAPAAASVPPLLTPSQLAAMHNMVFGRHASPQHQQRGHSRTGAGSLPYEQLQQQQRRAQAQQQQTSRLNVPKNPNFPGKTRKK